MAARIDHLVTSGTFALDGGEWDVDNNVWIVGDDTEAVVIDAAHDAAAIEAALGGRTLRAIICTHAHNDHIDAAPALADATGAPILLHPDDLPLWQQTHPDRAPTANSPTARSWRWRGLASRCCTPRATPRARSASTPPG